MNSNQNATGAFLQHYRSDPLMGVCASLLLVGLIAFSYNFSPNKVRGGQQPPPGRAATLPHAQQSSRPGHAQAPDAAVRGLVGAGLLASVDVRHRK